MFIRHGSRSAKEKETDLFKKLPTIRNKMVEKISNSKEKCPLSKQNWENLKKWQWNATYDQDRMLTKNGKKELQTVARNYKERFQHLFKGPYDKDHFNVLCANTPRTIESSSVFLDSIIGEAARKAIQNVADDDGEDIIKAYKDVDFNDKNKKIDDDPNSESNRFLRLPVYTNIIKRVSKEFYFDVEDDKTKAERVKSMYDLCRYEQSWDIDGKSVWCSIFSKKELEVLEYSKDLKAFYTEGPSGNELNYNVHCLSVIDMMKHLSVPSGPKVTAYFSHSPALLSHLTAMGAYKQEPKLTANNYEAMSKRIWKTSTFSPMAANFVGVLYNNNTVKFFLNEEEMPLPGCKNNLCDLAHLKKQFDHCKPQPKKPKRVKQPKQKK
ncbi:multiple inositol polyphosphate phosphatase 1-like [Sitodiplosis mosellana]|uniref:multiple inositol polyphosphate phosphatase 1-like n=1 Tax=Sitodiplosis mosellana TaxID=263140 RepID=UPI002443888C|nr:multiple inositol polyphosphate phosphatase 1-like [Sitodiplosis mosellana]